LLHLAGDMAGLLDSLGERHTVIAGHDCRDGQVLKGLS
jgi:hypothetical protein